MGPKICCHATIISKLCAAKIERPMDLPTRGDSKFQCSGSRGPWTPPGDQGSSAAWPSAGRGSGSVRMGAATLSAVPKLLHRNQVALHSQPPGGWHLPSGLAPLKPSTVCADGCLTYCRSSDLWRSELLQQHCQGFTQLEPVAGGVCEEESALSSKASILDSSAASRLFSISSSFVRFLLSSSRCSMS